MKINKKKLKEKKKQIQKWGSSQKTWTRSEIRAFLKNIVTNTKKEIRSHSAVITWTGNNYFFPTAGGEDHVSNAGLLSHQ